MLASVDHPCWTYSYESGGVRKTLWSEVTFWYFRNKTWNFSIEGISHFFHCELAMLLKQRNTTLILSCLCSLLRLAAAAADVEVVSASAVFPLQTQSQLDLCLLLTKLFWINICRYVAKLSRIEPTLFIRMCQKRSPNQNKVIFSDPLFEKSFVSAILDKLRENSIRGGTASCNFNLTGKHNFKSQNA